MNSEVATPRATVEENHLGRSFLSLLQSLSANKVEREEG